MAKSIRVTTKKRRGRPATTGRGTQIGERWHRPELAAIDRWIAAQGEEMTRAQAVRRLVELGLTIKTTVKQAPTAGAARAKELAANAIDTMIDATAPPEERAQRRRRLIKGPSEFREHRMDQAKRNDGRK